MRGTREAEPADAPREALPCVWMSAGLLAYRLCDREYDCEHCPLDAALRGPTSAAVPGRLVAWEFRDDRRYHPGHTWVRSEGRGRLRCGIDAFAARLAGQARGVVLPAVRSRLAPGQVACWLEDEDELIPLRGPACGIVLARNPRLASEPTWLAASPYDEGWLYELEGAAAPGLLDAAEIRVLAERQLARLGRCAARFMARGHATLGATAADGGEPVVDLRRVLGARRFRRLIAPYLG